MKWKHFCWIKIKTVLPSDTSVRVWKQQGWALSQARRTAEPVNLYCRQMQKGFISFLRADRLCLAPPLVVNLWSFVRIASRQAGASLQCTSARDESAYLAHVSVTVSPFLFRISSRKRRKPTIKPLNNCGWLFHHSSLIFQLSISKLRTTGRRAINSWLLYVPWQPKVPACFNLPLFLYT